MTQPGQHISPPLSVSQRLWQPLKTPVLAGLGGMLVITVLALLSQQDGLGLWLMAPFGATMVIVFALPASPLAQPRNIVGGHLLAALVGLSVVGLFGVHSWSLGLAVGLAISLMMLTGTLHPPAGANPLLIMLAGKSWSFVLSPILPGTLLIVLLATLYHRLHKQPYPQRWF